MKEGGKTNKKEGGKAPQKRFGKFQKKRRGKIQEWAPEIRPEHWKSLPNPRQQRRLRHRPKRVALRAAPLGFVVFHLVRNSYVFASLVEPILGRSWFSTFFFLGRAFPSSSPFPVMVCSIKKRTPTTGCKTLLEGCTGNGKERIFIGNYGPERNG